MGYYSSVKYVVEFPNVEHMKGFVAVNRLRNEHMIQAFDELQMVPHVYQIRADFPDTRWYDSDPEIQAHNEILRLAEEAGYTVAFVKSGEEAEDVEIIRYDGKHEDYAKNQSSSYDLLDTYRVIEFPTTVGDSEILEVKDFLKGETA
jgi:hypothetical protein